MSPDLEIRLKEAFKIGLALAIVFGIALSSGWMNPYWAGFAVGMTCLGTAGESFHKGALRVAGTVPGCVAALLILSLAPQSRWLFLFLVCGWVFVTTYLMIADKKHSYFWNVAGFVCLIITVTGGSSENLFEHAVFRTVETVMGVAVYTLISVFLWPRTNAGAIKNASASLLATQAKLFQAGRESVLGESAAENLPKRQAQQVQQLGQLGQALIAEGSESYEVQELRPQLERFQQLATATMAALDRWHAVCPEFERIADPKKVLRDLSAFLDELGNRFVALQQLLCGDHAGHVSQSVSLKIESGAFESLPVLDRAALALTKKELENLDSLTASMLDCVRNIAEEPALRRTGAAKPEPGAKLREWKLPVLDLDYLAGAAFAATATAVGFLIWVFINPPGHQSWFQMGGTVAMAVAGMPQMKTTALVKPVGIGMALGLAVYVFILPHLSTFPQLGFLIFLCMFINCLFFSGISRLAGTLGILNMISIQNQQSYNFAAMANSYVFTLLVFVFVFAMSYLLRSPRPEKAVLRLLNRFFRSIEILIGQISSESGRKLSLFGRWRAAFYRHELTTLPAKIGAWGRSINRQKFPNNTPEQTQALVTSLQGLVYRVEQLLDASDRGGNSDSVLSDLDAGVESWRREISRVFARGLDDQAAETQGDLKKYLKNWLDRIETLISGIAVDSKKAPTEEESEKFYQLIGGYRGVSEATVAFAGAADQIDWAHWREERF